jgi:16S rRNA processing protein RimM
MTVRTREALRGAPKDEGAPGTASSGRRLITLARIGKAHGLQGEVKIEILGQNAGALTGAPWLFVGPTQLDARRMKVEGVRGGAGRPILKLGGVDGPEEARALAGSKIFLPRRAFAPAGEEEFYQVDLIGLRVIAQGDELGRIEEIVETPAFDVLVLRRNDPKSEERLVPFTRSVLQEVRTGEGLVLVHPPATWEVVAGGGRETERSGGRKKRRARGRRNRIAPEEGPD